MLAERTGGAGAARAKAWAAAGLFGLAMLGPMGGCALTPKDAAHERERLKVAGGAYETPLQERVIAELPAAPTWRDVLQRAFAANGELEAAYFEWKAAVERIDIASAYPNSNVSLGYSYMFSSERMKTFDRQTFSAGFDPSVSLSFPTKVTQKGKVALDEAKVSAEKFRAAKFELQRRVLTAWAEYGLLAEKLRIQKEQLGLTRMAIDSARAGALAGGGQRGILKADVSLRTAEDSIRGMEAELSASRAMLNGMLARKPDAELTPELSAAGRALAASDDVVLATAAEQNPELAGLAEQVRGRADALELARMAWIPDISPTAMFTGSLSQALGAAVMLPTNVVEIRGGIREAEAMLRGSEAMLRQTAGERNAAVVATLVTLRNSERQAALFDGGIVPLAERLAANTRQAYAAGAGMYGDLLEAQRTVLEARLVAAEARAMREKQLATLESLMGTDVEMLAGGRGEESHER